MSQDPGLGDFRVLAWRPGQANDAFQALKRHFDAPPGTVEFTGFAAGEGYCVKGGNKNGAVRELCCSYPQAAARAQLADNEPPARSQARCQPR